MSFAWLTMIDSSNPSNPTSHVARCLREAPRASSSCASTFACSSSASTVSSWIAGIIAAGAPPGAACDLVEVDARRAMRRPRWWVREGNSPIMAASYPAARTERRAGRRVGKVRRPWAWAIKGPSG
jgi:hypothetical protein